MWMVTSTCDLQSLRHLSGACHHSLLQSLRHLDGVELELWMMGNFNGDLASEKFNIAAIAMEHG